MDRPKNPQLLTDRTLSSEGISRSQVAQRLLEERKIRSELFPDVALFEGPAWDILLQVYLGHSLGKGATIDSVSIAARLPVTSALRWLKALEGKGLVFAYRDNESKGGIFVRLSDQGHSQMARYIDRMASIRPD